MDQKPKIFKVGLVKKIIEGNLFARQNKVVLLRETLKNSHPGPSYGLLKAFEQFPKFWKILGFLGFWKSGPCLVHNSRPVWNFDKIFVPRPPNFPRQTRKRFIRFLSEQVLVPHQPNFQFWTKTPNFSKLVW